MKSTADPMSRIKKARAKLIGHGMIPEGLVPQPIERSWKRCLSMGISVEEKQDFDPLSVGDLSSVHEQHHILIAHAEPVMETLREQILNTGSMVILTDASGLILRSIGDADFMSKAKRVALQSGVSWNENCKGTNAIGTSLAEEKPVTVHGPQHFIAANTFLTCSASPIVSPEGRMIGVLDVSGDYRSYQQHTLALVRMSVQMIENRLFREQYPKCALLRFHSRPEFIGTLCEGIVVFSEDGHFLSANRSAIFQLGMDLQRLRGLTFESLFSLPFSALLDRVHTHRPLALNLHNGVRVFTVIEAAASLERDTAALPRVHARPVQRELKSVPSFESLDSGDPRIAAIVKKLRRVIDRDIPVLIIGETGAGKELFARALHNASGRAAGPFVPVNCAAIPDGLVESELFGYEEGAFTGARRKGAPGKMHQAHGGTLFLDEIGDMPLTLQARLLRVLQERSITPLGSTKSQPVDIRIACATNQKLRDLVECGKFRTDLYYRLNGLVVQLPPLRERTDIRCLVERVLEQESRDVGQVGISPEVMSLFESHPWPGNIRQLRNLLRTAVTMLDGEKEISRAHLSDDFLEDACKQLVPMQGDLGSLTLAAIRRALDVHHGNVSSAARELGISRNTLYRKLKQV